VVSAAVNVPIFCLIRPRRGHFVYSRKEIQAMKTDILLLRAIGRADGFVLGALNERGELDAEVCRELLEVVSPLPATLHRAIDVCAKPLEAVDIAIQLGWYRDLNFVDFFLKKFNNCPPKAISEKEIHNFFMFNRRFILLQGLKGF